MTLKKHIIDTIKEWQLKIGNIDTDIRLYYPKSSLCDYMEVPESVSDDDLLEMLSDYMKNKAEELGNVNITYNKDRYCIEVLDKGCKYVEDNIDTPEFLTAFLAALKTQKFEEILEVFKRYARENNTELVFEKETDGLGTVLYLKDENVEPYVYCVEQDDFGITYHRFAKDDYLQLATLSEAEDDVKSGRTAPITETKEII